jgi:hypothetical protein
MKHALKIIGIVLLVLFVLVIGPAIYFVHQLGKPFDEARHFLLHDVDYHAVSVACLDLITQPQYRPLIGEYPSGDDSRLPVAIRDVKALWLSVSANEVMIMKTGGFYHMGLVFHRSATNANTYELVFREERQDVPDRLLYSLPLPKDPLANNDTVLVSNNK